MKTQNAKDRGDLSLEALTIRHGLLHLSTALYKKYVYNSYHPSVTSHFLVILPTEKRVKTPLSYPASDISRRQDADLCGLGCCYC